jgi:hypothetical protein
MYTVNCGIAAAAFVGTNRTPASRVVSPTRATPSGALPFGRETTNSPFFRELSTIVWLSAVGETASSANSSLTLPRRGAITLARSPSVSITAAEAFRPRSTSISVLMRLSVYGSCTSSGRSTCCASNRTSVVAS